MDTVAGQFIDQGVVQCSCCSLENPGHFFFSPFLTVPLRGVYASVKDKVQLLDKGGVPVVVQRQVFRS